MNKEDKIKKIEEINLKLMNENFEISSRLNLLEKTNISFFGDISELKNRISKIENGK